ncbi:MAG: TonB-dependent receptor [Ignavibacteriales bacterium]|nr:TonB-dependent receptor [Ignavibacteriales bacterium]
MCPWYYNDSRSNKYKRIKWIQQRSWHTFLVAIDGIPIYTPDTGEIIWELIPINDIERIEILKGASSSLYGSSAIGGVINIITKEITSNPLHLLNFKVGFMINQLLMNGNGQIKH